ncbi:MAG: hypothetical protein L0229_01915 [Blastocatellia bacterium]|nr:hypothetical protein [Blastocatellia bacterium]
MPGYIFRFAVSAVILMLALTAVAARRPGSVDSHTIAMRDGLKDLQDVEQLKVLFNKDDGTVRIILLLSPT